MNKSYKDDVCCSDLDMDMFTPSGLFITLFGRSRVLGKPADNYRAHLTSHAVLQPSCRLNIALLAMNGGRIKPPGTWNRVRPFASRLKSKRVCFVKAIYVRRVDCGTKVNCQIFLKHVIWITQRGTFHEFIVKIQTPPLNAESSVNNNILAIRFGLTLNWSLFGPRSNTGRDFLIWNKVSGFRLFGWLVGFYTR